MENYNFIAVKEAALLLSVSPGTIRNLISRGHLKAFKIGKQIRIERESLNKYIKTSEMVIS